MSSVNIERDDAIATITINRPDKLNALDATVLADVAGALMDAVSYARCAILTGAGKAFVAGADIAAMLDMSPPEALAFSDQGHDVCRMIEELDFPVIAAVNGFALGGGLELALACDFIYASDRAKLGQPETKLGIIPGFGGTQRLMRRVGVGHARELIYGGGMIKADEALRIGLVNRVVPGDELLDSATKTAAQIAAVGPLAVTAAKRAMRHGAGMSLADANELESQTFAGLFGTEDRRIGMQAFVDKKDAVFVGR